MTHPLDPVTLTPRELDGMAPLRLAFREAYDALMALPPTDARVWAEAALQTSSQWAARAYAEGVEKRRAT